MTNTNYHCRHCIIKTFLYMILAGMRNRTKVWLLCLYLFTVHASWSTHFYVIPVTLQTIILIPYISTTLFAAFSVLFAYLQTVIEQNRRNNNNNNFCVMEIPSNTIEIVNETGNARGFLAIYVYIYI